jgi:DNA-binding transcriptional MerR regulator
MAGLPSYTLRYWETEFKFLQPRKATTGQRMYEKNDVESVFLLKHLLHERKFTIEGARQHIKVMKKGETEEPAAAPASGTEAKSRSKSKSKSDGTQLGFGFDEMKLKDKMKKVAQELRAIEKSLRSE